MLYKFGRFYLSLCLSVCLPHMTNSGPEVVAMKFVDDDDDDVCLSDDNFREF